MNLFLNLGLRSVLPGLLVLIWTLPAPTARAQQPEPQDSLSEEIRAAEAERDAAFRELEARRAEYLEALRRAEEIERRQAMRPPTVAPSAVDPIAEAEAYWRQPYVVAPSPYVLRPVPRSVVGVPVGPPYPYGLVPVNPYAPYGYGYRAPGGIDIPFGFGLGGLSIRW